MSAAKILHEVQRQGVRLYLVGDKLRYQGEATRVARVLPLLRQHKSEIINHLYGAKRPPVALPLLDPMEHGFLATYAVMNDLAECGGYPKWCSRCRLLMADLETCLLGPSSEAEQ